MAQRLIVEGNDAIFLSQLCKLKGLPPPLGYSNPVKYRKEFVKSAGGISKVKLILKEELQSPEVTHIGVIVDANEVGVAGRWDSLKQTIESTLSIKIRIPNFPKNGFTQVLPDQNLQLGVWIMPDNEHQGYLEHFATELVEQGNSILAFTREILDDFWEKDFCQLTEPRKQKALLHTYLALQEKPGLSLGTALAAGYFEKDSLLAKRFLNWFQHSFELGY